MSTISKYLKEEYNSRKNKQNVISDNETVVASLVGLGISERYEVLENQRFEDWNQDFNFSFQEKWNEYSAHRELTLDHYKGLIQEYENNPTEEGLLEIEKTIRNLRSQDVQSRWDFEHFFANEGGPGAQSVLGYHDYDIENSSTPFINYTDEQFDILKQDGIIRIDGKALEGHHMNDVSTNAFDPETIDLTFSADNIDILTREAHLYSTDFGHAGSWQNSTESSGSSIFETKSDLIQGNRDFADSKISALNIETGLGIGAGAGLITFCIKLYQIKDDPRPWKKKATIAASSALINGASIAMFSVIANKIRTSIYSAFQSVDIISPDIIFAQDVLSDSFMEPISGLGLENLGDIFAYGGSITSIRMLRETLSTISTWQSEGSLLQALNQFGNNAIKIAAQESKYMGLSYIIGLLAPDPTGIVTIWRIGKGVYKWFMDKETFKTCYHIKIDAQYKLAKDSLKLLN